MSCTSQQRRRQVEVPYINSNSAETQERCAAELAHKTLPTPPLGSWPPRTTPTSNPSEETDAGLNVLDNAGCDKSGLALFRPLFFADTSS
jgi:hypothetical protein